MEHNPDTPPKGLICPLVTPLKRGTRLDTAALEKLIRHVGPSVDGILLGDMIYGEGEALDIKTRLDLFSSGLDLIRGKWPVFLTITSKNRRETANIRELAEATVKRMDYSGPLFWFDTPIYYHGNRGLPGWYQSILQQTAFGILLANRPEWVKHSKPLIKHKNVRTHVFKKIAAIKQVKGLVFSGSVKRSIHYRKAAGIRRDFRFYDIDEYAFMKQPSTHGVVAVGANLLSEAWQTVTASCLNTHEVQNSDDRRQILETAGMLETCYMLYIHNPPALLKRLLQIVGVLPSDDLAPGTLAATEEQKRQAEYFCRKYRLA